MPRKTTLAALAGLALIAAAPAAFAGDRDGDDGWAPPDRGCHCECGCEGAQEVHLPSSFFYDDGGVGPAYFDYGTSGGAIVIDLGASRASASASASARASAEARAFAHVGVRIGIHAHGGMMHMHGGYGGKHW